MSQNGTSIWLQSETHERLSNIKPPALTYNEVVNAALDEAGFEPNQEFQLKPVEED